MRNTDARTVALTVIKGGIDRLRTKGGARADSLYELRNGFVTERGTVKTRPGTARITTLPAGTVGLVGFNDCLHVFASEAVSIGSESLTVTVADLGDGFSGFDGGGGAVDPDPGVVGSATIEEAYSNTSFFFLITTDGLPSGHTSVDVETETAETFETLDFDDATEVEANVFRWANSEINWRNAEGSDRTLRFGTDPSVDFCVDILLHPADPSAELTEIHFAQPFLGALYVVAEFDSDEIFDYWLQSPDAWEAGEEYSANELVVPNTANGFAYRATRYGSAYPKWSPGVSRTAGNGSSVDPSIVEPTVYNEYYYTVVSTGGDNPRSGSSEPVWPTNDGQTVIENTDGFEATTPDEVAPPTPPANNQPQSTTTSRYQR